MAFDTVAGGVLGPVAGAAGKAVGQVVRKAAPGAKALLGRAKEMLAPRGGRDLQAIVQKARTPILGTKADKLRTLTVNEHASGRLTATGSVKPTPAQRQILKTEGVTEVPAHGKALCLPGKCGHHAEQRGIAYGELIDDPVVRQASSSGASHGGKACPSCAAEQAARNVKNVTGKQ
jgi:hypothetical protein